MQDRAPYMAPCRTPLLWQNDVLGLGVSTIDADLWYRGDTELTSGTAGERPVWWWTGAAPMQGTPGVLADGTITSLPAPNLGTCTRQEVLSYFTNR